MSTLAMGQNGGWHTHAYHYEDKEGNILSEVYQLTKL